MKTPSTSWTTQQIKAAIVALQTYDGCTDTICTDVQGENCECGRIIRHALSAIIRANGEIAEDK